MPNIFANHSWWWKPESWTFKRISQKDCGWILMKFCDKIYAMLKVVLYLKDHGKQNSYVWILLKYCMHIYGRFRSSFCKVKTKQVQQMISEVWINFDEILCARILDSICKNIGFNFGEELDRKKLQIIYVLAEVCTPWVPSCYSWIFLFTFNVQLFTHIYCIILLLLCSSRHYELATLFILKHFTKASLKVVSFFFSQHVKQSSWPDGCYRSWWHQFWRPDCTLFFQRNDNMGITAGVCFAIKKMDLI